MSDCVTVLSFWAMRLIPDAMGRLFSYVLTSSSCILNLFETHPDVQKLFPKFSGLPKEQLQNNPNLQAHGEIQHKIPLVNFQVLQAFKSSMACSDAHAQNNVMKITYIKFYQDLGF
uniref:Globin domain-containing protein n=1 Tax=Erpetoichthys calabaricus TaxID=27687 RepID=A0A8C4X8F6_ERPCA